MLIGLSWDSEKAASPAHTQTPMEMLISYFVWERYHSYQKIFDAQKAPEIILSAVRWGSKENKSLTTGILRLEIMSKLKTKFSLESGPGDEIQLLLGNSVSLYE